MKDNNRKKALVLGGIASFCDLADEMESMGIEPVICDYYEDAPAKKMGYQYYDVSTTDIKSIVDIAKKHRVDGIISAFSDRNLHSAYIVTEKLNLPQLYDEAIVELLTDKLKMKNYFRKNGLPIIEYRILNKEFKEQELKGLKFPVVTKPIDAYGSKGIFVCNSIQEIREAFDNTVREALKYKDCIIVEEYYPVDEISIAAWVKGGRSYISCIYDVNKNHEPNIVLSSVSFPSKYTQQHLTQFGILVQKMVTSCGICEGPVTVQCFIGEKGIKISELLFRLAGGSPYLYSTYIGGPNLARMQIQFQVENPIDYQNLEVFQPVGNGDIYFDIQIFVKEGGKLYHEIDVNEIKKRIPECVDLRVYHKSGNEIKNIFASGKIVARAVCKLKDRQEKSYYELILRLNDAVKVYNGQNECVSFIRVPEKLELNKTSDINWSFI